ncbi:hypothetical protein BLA29_007680, partial [Euroglyphus maynei]
MFGDPCPGTLKYLEAHYQCVKALPPHIDLTSQDIKDQEEAVEKAPLSIVDEPGPIQVKPPKPIDLSEDSSQSIDQDDNNYDLPSIIKNESDDSSDDTPYNRGSSSSTTVL